MEVDEVVKTATSGAILPFVEKYRPDDLE